MYGSSGGAPADIAAASRILEQGAVDGSTPTSHATQARRELRHEASASILVRCPQRFGLRAAKRSKLAEDLSLDLLELGVVEQSVRLHFLGSLQSRHW